MRLHTRTIIRDRCQAFVGSQSLRTLELDSRREVGLIIRDPKAVKQLIDTFESDWAVAGTKSVPSPPDPVQAPVEEPAGASPKETAKAVAAFTEELQPLADTVRAAVRQAVAQAGEDVLRDKDVKDTMKKVAKEAIKGAVKDAVQDAVQDAHDAPPPKGVT